MGRRDARVDAYIERAAPFAQPLLVRLRDSVHAACPEVSETIKWGMPFFELDGPLCFMAAFKKHCGFGFWKGLPGAEATPDHSGEAMGQLGRLTSLADLPASRTLRALIRTAAARNAERQKAPPAPRVRRPPPEVPPVLAAALKKHPAAQATFAAFSPSRQREYTEWIAEAKAEATRERRLAQALQQLAAGKPRHG